MPHNEGIIDIVCIICTRFEINFRENRQIASVSEEEEEEEEEEAMD